LILQQANFLRHEVSPAAGVEVVIQNQELLGVKVSDRRKIDLDVESPVAWRPGGRSTPTSQANSARDRTRAGVSGLAAGLFERAQKAGLDKAFRSTVNDFRVSSMGITSG
jgi:TBC1 domain family protein 5